MTTVYYTAVQLAEDLHQGQTDKAGKPYFEHLERVAEIVRVELKGDIRDAINAFLHDIVEDTPVSLRLIERIFDREHRLDIDALSHRDDEPYHVYIDRIIARGERAMIVKYADLLDHLRLGHQIPASLVKRYTKSLTKIEVAYAALGKPMQVSV